MRAESASRVRAVTGGDRFRCSTNDQLTSLMAALGSQIENPIGAFDDVEMMLDHQHRMPGLHEPLQAIQQALDIGEMQSGGGFVKNVEVMAAAAHFAQLGREFDALRFATGQNGGGVAKFEITEAQFVQYLQLADDGA